MKLSAATKLAERILEELAPLCAVLTVAGSIRRQCAEVNDIDLVAIPHDQYQFRARVLRNAQPIQDGPVNLIVRLQNNVQLDIFMARAATQDLIDKRPTNFGTLLLCRTGSKEHNIKVAHRAISLGLKWKPYEGVLQPTANGDLLVASTTEEQIFRTLRMDYIEPMERT